MKKVLLITSGQPSLNPRLVKEADALAEKGFKVTVLYQYWNLWGTKLDEGLLKTKKWKVIRVGGDPDKEKVNYNVSRIIHKVSRIIFQKMGLKAAAIGAIARSSYHLIKTAKKIKADIYIGHNLGALPATIFAADFHKRKCGFDAEDFHRQETSDEQEHPDVKLNKYLEDRFFPHLNYLTTASPLITEQYKKLYPDLNISTITNVFPKEDTIFNLSDEEPLKLFWFSQTVGVDRGLEDVLKAIGLLPYLAIELHLLGSVSAKVKKELLSIADAAHTEHYKIIFYDPIDSDRITTFASQFHIGLATETGVPFNRDICLTNKIFTYIQAGLVVLASDTQAQKQLLNTYPGLGAIYERGNIGEITSLIEKYYNNRNLLNKQKFTAYQLGKDKLNWEEESKKFIGIVELQLK